jgi:hypothetical protein
MHTYNPSIWEDYKFKAILYYKVSSRPAWVTSNIPFKTHTHTQSVTLTMNYMEKKLRKKL